MTYAQDITRHFKGDWHGSYGSFPAPGHSKDDRGVTVKDVPDGDVLFNSFNGGDWREIKDECRRLGLLPRRERANDNCNGPRETGHYEYADGDGTVLYRTVRVEQAGQRKKFKAQRPDGRGGWINGIGDVNRVPYRLPEIKAAIGKAALKDEPLPTIYLVEGERKADTLAAWGLTATAVAFGCKGWRKAYADVLAGCTVVILPDNDDEGSTFAERAGADLEAAGCRVVRVDLPGLPPKGDIVDWTGSASELQALVSAAMADNSEAALLPALDLAALAQTRAHAKEFAIEKIAPLGEVTKFTGPGSAGKSLLGQQFATAAAAGIGSCLGLAVKPCSAIYITCEDDAEQLHWRQQHICDSLGVDMASLAGVLRLASLRGILGNELATFGPDSILKPTAAYHRLVATIRADGAKLVFLDNVSHLFTGNENDRGEVTRFVNLLNKLAGETGAAVLLLGHTNKAGDTYSGSTAWLNAVRSQVWINHIMDDEGNIADPDMRVLTVGKANYTAKGEAVRFRWHQWAFVLEGDLPPDTRAQISEIIKAGGENDAFLACLRARTEQGDGREVGPSPGPSYAPTQFEGMPQAKGYKKAAFKRAMDRLYEIGKIRSETIRDRKAGRDKTIIAEVVEDVHNASHNPRTTPSHNPAQPAAQPRTTHSHISKDIPGAASGSAAPSMEGQEND